MSERIMGNFSTTVDFYMSSPVHSVQSAAALLDAHALMHERSVSSLAVLEGNELVGVISRTDLLRVGRRDAGTSRDASLLTFPDKPVSDVMTSGAVTLGPGDSIRRAAQLMTADYLHRVYVVSEKRLVGVVSTKEIARAVTDARIRTPIREHMSSPVFTVRVEEPISLATERLEKARVSGLVVVDGDWPVGVFTQEEALESRALERDSAVETAMSSAMICLDVTTPLHRAAAHAVAMDVRRLIAIENRRLEGILTGLDFAHFAA